MAVRELYFKEDLSRRNKNGNAERNTYVQQGKRHHEEKHHGVNKRPNLGSTKTAFVK